MRITKEDLTIEEHICNTFICIGLLLIAEITCVNNLYYLHSFKNMTCNYRSEEECIEALLDQMNK